MKILMVTVSLSLVDFVAIKVQLPMAHCGKLQFQVRIIKKMKSLLNLY